MKNFRKIICGLLILCMMPVFGGCSTNTKTKKQAKETTKTEDQITITDHAGNKVTLPSKINRIAVCGIYPLPSVLTVFFNSADKIVGMPEQSMVAAKNGLLGELYPDILKAKTNYCDEDEVNTEELLKLKPDVVFYGAESKAIGTKLRNAGFNAVGISVNKWDYDSIETLNEWISLLSKIFPENNKAKVVKKYSDDVYDKIQKRVSEISDKDKANAFFLFKYDESLMASSGNSFFGQWWADAIGAKNVGEKVKKDNAIPVNMEQVYKWNPDIIFITNFTKANPDDLYKNTIGSYDWSKVDAVKNKKVYKMPLGMYRSYTPGVDTPMTLLWLAKTTYPDEFDDIDMTEEVKDYYKEVFDVELTDKQVESIFAPASEAGDVFSGNK